MMRGSGVGPKGNRFLEHSQSFRPLGNQRQCRAKQQIRIGRFRLPPQERNSFLD
jgi:hypothetical protein